MTLSNGLYTEEEKTIRRVARDVYLQECKNIPDDMDELVAWAREQRAKQAKWEATKEKLRGTVIGQIVIWLLIGSGWMVYTAITSWIVKIKDDGG